ncbi:MAG: hypothetical protein IPM18_04010 [Phycisphaerales bacterium]|nr:hypothetical protein [Phycisphaerales bacterium]
MPLPRVLGELLALPTAAFVEDAVLAYLKQALKGLPGVRVRQDEAGNLHAHYRSRPGRRRPLAFVAHTDHPGFVALEMIGHGRVRAVFRGGVRPEYFPGARVRFWDGQEWRRGRIEKLKLKQANRRGWPAVVEEAEIRVSGEVPPNAPGMWDLPEPVLRGDRVVARGCDDVAGVAALVLLLKQLSRRRAAGEVHVLFTRAEEVGFIGAIAAAKAGTIPRAVPVISVETSSALAGAELGGGPILRVGDRSSIFTPRLTAFCERVAAGLAKQKKDFRVQRKLMDGGTCEAYPFIALGYEATGICVALGNYHNMDVSRKKIGSEYISLRDWQRMVVLFEALVCDPDGPDAEDGRARERLEQLYASQRHLL